MTKVNQFFTKKNILSLIHCGINETYISAIKECGLDVKNKTNSEIISEIYSYYITKKRNEYFYINTLLSKLINEKTVQNSTALTQVRIADHIADFVFINHEGCVYEIKSELDNLRRLKYQIFDYYKAFSKVSVLTSPNFYNSLRKILKDMGNAGESVGILTLNKNNIISRSFIKIPLEYNEHLDYYSMFSTLRKKEYENVIMKRFGNIPDVPPAFSFKKNFELFKQLPIKEAQDEFLSQLKRRNGTISDLLLHIPKEFMSVIYFSRMYNHVELINNFLNTKFGEL